MSVTQAAGPGRCAKVDSQYLLLCLAVWQGQHDPEAGWALIEAARESEGEDKQVAIRLLKSMVEDEDLENLEPASVPDAIEFTMSQEKRLTAEPVGLALGERG